MITHSDFKPAWWLPGPHAQTLAPYLFRHSRLPSLRRLRMELDDGDFLDLDWSPLTEGPVVLLLHGLEGSINSHYAGGLLSCLYHAGMTVVFMHFRGCSGEPNRLPRSYHSGETGDLETVLRRIRQDYPDRPLSAVGVSLGGNVLLKWLGEQHEQTLLNRAVAVSVPFELDRAAKRLQQGFSRVYQYFLLGKLRRSMADKSKRVSLPIGPAQLRELKTLYAFDDTFTAPLHGFQSADDYYQRSSSRRFLATINTATLILHACDDPFMDPSVIPEAHELSSQVTLELSEHGGHVGFIAGHWPGRPVYWLEQRVKQFLLEA